MKSEIEELIAILGVTDKDAIRALLSAFAPPQPGPLAQAWKNRKNYHGALPTPTTSEFWAMFEEADFRCTLCGSQLRITIDHINGDETDHRKENLKVLCFECNRAKNERGIRHKATSYRVYRAIVDLYKKTSRFPTSEEIVREAGIEKMNAAMYLARFLEKRLTGTSAIVRHHKKANQSVEGIGARRVG